MKNMRPIRAFAFAWALALSGALVVVTPGVTAAPASRYPAVTPAASDYQQLSASTTPPTEAQCNSVGRRCFNPASIRAAYNLNGLVAGGMDGGGITVAIIDSFGSDTMAHDLHVYNQAFGLPPMCGEEGVTCAPGMPTFSRLALQGAPATKAPPATAKSPGLQDKSAWAIEVALDVETVHAVAPGANILLVTTPVAETLGVQGLPQMMAAEKYVVDNHLAQVITQSFGTAEEAFNTPSSLLNLRGAFTAAAASGVTVLASTGDNGTANVMKAPVGGPNAGPTIPYPTVGWPASDPLVTAVGGTYLCTDPTATVGRVTLSSMSPTRCLANPGVAEVGWIASGGGYSHVFGKPDYQNTLPAGSTQIGAMRGIPDVALLASATTGTLEYLSLPPDGQSGILCGGTPCSTGWYVVGGTSLSSPAMAGIVAIAAQLNGGGLGLINPALYKIGADPTRYAADFFDVTTGNNTLDPSVPGYPATTGWDPVTGLGTINGENFVPDLVAAVHGN
ncbi:S53 family peptidase [Microbacterium rhizosphaerae]|uniref:S53 family peptidase n=1 Tax=Microbacterium rhizosphaerae TaxID=1678237 RepID=A0ABZ0SNS4_9MICO|nr:S53 family peptidase [Microbacterium rhizosphaerae]WPR91002.1 S53 family peptidase [Microbacterium rhizosphaerae]